MLSFINITMYGFYIYLVFKTILWPLHPTIIKCHSVKWGEVDTSHIPYTSMLIYFVLCFFIIKSKSRTQRWWILFILCFLVLLLLMRIGVGPCDKPTQSVPMWCIAASLNGHCQVIIWKGWPRTIVSAVFWGFGCGTRFAR